MHIDYMNVVKKNMFMTTELIKVIDLLDQKNIHVLVLKGPVLSQLAYNSIVSRQYADIDILVDEKDILSVSKILLDNQYRTEFTPQLLKNKTYLKIDNDFSFFSKKNVHLELHWRLFRKKLGIHQTFYDYYQDSYKVKLSNTYARTLSLEYTLVYLSIHGSKHAWERIEWINDIYFLINKHLPKIDWDEVLKITHNMQSNLALFSALKLCKVFYDLSLPINIEKKISSNKVENIAQEAIYFISKPQSEQNNYNHYKQVMLFQTKLLPTKTAKIRYILNSYFTITRNDFFAFPLPPYLYFTYYFIKPIRIILKIFTQQK